MLEKRLLKRAQHSGRSDDKVDVIKKRFKVYVEQSQPIEAKLKLMGPFIEVKADGTIDEVFQKIATQLDEKLKE
jgi:adenylate kinase family enzyme